MIVFEVRCVLKKLIRLTKNQWAHIKRRHPEMEFQEEKMKAALENPDEVYYSKGEETYHYYKFFKSTPVTEKFLTVVVKHLNEDGFVITSYFVHEIGKRDMVTVWEKG